MTALQGLYAHVIGPSDLIRNGSNDNEGALDKTAKQQSNSAKRKRNNHVDRDRRERPSPSREEGPLKQLASQYDVKIVDHQRVHHPSIPPVESLVKLENPKRTKGAAFPALQSGPPEKTIFNELYNPPLDSVLSSSSTVSGPFDQDIHYQLQDRLRNQTNEHFVERGRFYDHAEPRYLNYDYHPEFTYSSADPIDVGSWSMKSRADYSPSTLRARGGTVVEGLSQHRALTMSKTAGHSSLSSKRPLQANILPCDVPCDEDCESEDCTSCDGSQTCCEPCSNPEFCSSGDCDDPNCFEATQDLCIGDHSPRFPHNFTENPVSPDNSYVNPQHLLLDCHWETSGQQCDASMPSLNSLSQHVLQDHIQPQAILPCQWNHCSNQIEVDDIPTHVWQCHSPAPEAASYVCLWHGCGTSFSSTEELDTHMKAVHCQISCHWDGCEQATTSETALKAHVDKKHITNVVGCPSREVTPASTTLSTPKSHEPPLYSNEKPENSLSLHKCEVHSHEGTCFPGSNSTDSGNAGTKTCQWLQLHGICGKEFGDGNKLQSHVESAHLSNMKHSGESNARQSARICQWNGCKTKISFAERSKLARHVFIHTKFSVGACIYCGKEYNNQNQLTDHERTHTKEKPFVCGKCDFKTTNKAALSTHMRTHTGEKPLKCDRCSYTCGDPSNMSKHRKTHETPLHKCELCEKAFCRMATLKRHMLSHETKGTK